MALVTVGSIIDRALRKADMFGSQYIGEQELLDLFNEGYAELYDLLVSRFEDYYSVDTNITISSLTDTYALPDDFYKSIGVDFRTGASGSGYITLRQFGENERNNYFGGVFSAIPSGTIRLRYVPLPTVYTDRAETIQGMSGWETYIVDYMTMFMLQKEESQTAVLERALQKMEKRVQEMAQNRDIGMPGRVTDMSVIDYTPQWANLRYHLQGNNIIFLAQELVDLTYWLY